MEVLYNVPLLVPKKTHSQVVGITCMSWSVDNKLACSLVTTAKEPSHMSESQVEHVVVILDPDRPWIAYGGLPAGTEPISLLLWSGNGKKIVVCDDTNKLSIHENNLSSINLWKCVSSISLYSSPLAVLWYETIDKYTLHSEQSSLEGMVSVRPAPYHVRFLHGKVILAVLEDGTLCTVWLQNGMMETYHSLPELDRPVCCDITILENGDILCLAVSMDQVVMVYRIFIATNKSVIVNKVAQWKPSVPGCVKKAILLSVGNSYEVHLLIDGIFLEKWMLNEVQLGLQARLITKSSHFKDIVNVATSCFPFSCDRESQSLSAGQLVLKQSDGMLTCLRRSDYTISSMCPPQSESEEYVLSGAKRSRLENSSPLAVSPSGCCVIHFTPHNFLSALHCGSSLLGPTSAGMNDLFVQKVVNMLYGVLLSGRTVWDLAVYVARTQKNSGAPLVSWVIKELEKVFESQSTTMQKMYIHHYCVLKSTLVRCLNNGMTPSLDVIEGSKLYAVFGYIVGCLPSTEGGQCLADLVAKALVEGPVDANLDTITASVGTSISLGSNIVQSTQLAVKWIMEYIARVAYRIASRVTDRIPDKCVLSMLRQALVLFDILQPSLPVPKCPTMDNTIACFYKILTLYITNMEVNITKEMVPDVTKLPREDQHQELSHRKAVYLQGFLHGLSDVELPELYSGHGCGIRKNVLQCQNLVNPFTPFTLEVPGNLPPIWSSSSPEGERDIVKGNLIPISALQRSGLLQCSRCQGWSLAGITQLIDKCGPTASTWDQLWLSRCPCGGQWTFKDTSSFQ